MNESAARESASDPPFSLFNIGVDTADSYLRKTIKHITVNCRPPSIARQATSRLSLRNGSMLLSSSFTLCCLVR